MRLMRVGLTQSQFKFKHWQLLPPTGGGGGGKPGSRENPRKAGKMRGKFEKNGKENGPLFMHHSYA